MPTQIGAVVGSTTVIGILNSTNDAAKANEMNDEVNIPTLRFLVLLEFLLMSIMFVTH